MKKAVFVVLIALILLVSAETLLDVDPVSVSMDFWYRNVKENIVEMKSGQYSPYREFNHLINHYFFTYTKTTLISDMVLQKLGPEMGYYMQCYLRDLIAGTLVYWITALLWHIAIYNVLGKHLFKNRKLPTSDTIKDQMALAQSSVFMYAALPILSEYLIENNLTKVYFFVDEIGGWGFYLGFLFLYIVGVEIGIYWMHRTLHTNKFLYKYVHGLHHKYNKAETLTPWASIAFNPLDGILQVYFFFICY